MANIPVIFKLMWVFWIPVSIFSFIAYYFLYGETTDGEDISFTDPPVNSIGYTTQHILMVIGLSGIFCSVVVPVVYYLYCITYVWVIWLIALAKVV